MSLRFRICLAAWIAVLVLTGSRSNAQDLELLPMDEPLTEQSDVAAPTAPADIDQSPPEEGLKDDFAEVEPVAAPAPAPADDGIMLKPMPEPVHDTNWVISVQPALKLSDVEHPQGAEYRRLYKSIPYNNAEFRANPTYRHDATMELLTGNARHQTIVRHGAPETVIQQPASTGGGIYNPSRFGYLRPALRLNYYRHFPSLNPYLNAGNLSGAF